MKNKKPFSLSLKKARVANLNFLKAGTDSFDTNNNCETTITTTTTVTVTVTTDTTMSTNTTLRTGSLDNTGP